MSVKDNISIECEARAMINESQYETLLSFHREHAKSYKELVNINTYFDTEDRYLVHHHMVLRIREVENEKDELTLKVKGDNGDIEITYLLDEKEKEEMCQKCIIPSIKIKDELLSRGVDISHLSLVSKLKTERMEVYLRSYIFVIDKNYYNNKVDFNIEVEAKDKKCAKKHLNELGALVGVSYQKGYISKSRRAILNL